MPHHIEKLIENFAHDYRDLTMTESQLEGLLRGFVKEMEALPAHKGKLK